MKPAIRDILKNIKMPTILLVAKNLPVRRDGNNGKPNTYCR